MDTKKKLQNALKEAVRTNDDVRKRTIRMALSSIKLAEVEKRADLEESAVLAILQKEVKTRKEVIAESQQAGRSDLVAIAQEEIEVLEEFLPQAMSNEELEIFVQGVINEVEASSMRDMGKVMKELMPRLEGRATGEQASQAVRKFLN